MKPKQILTNNLRLCRFQAGLRQIDVADHLKLDCANRLSRWENGSSIPSVINLFQLAALYKVLPHELYQETWQTMENRGNERVPETTTPSQSGDMNILLNS